MEQRQHAAASASINERSRRLGLRRIRDVLELSHTASEPLQGQASSRKRGVVGRDVVSDKKDSDAGGSEAARRVAPERDSVPSPLAVGVAQLDADRLTGRSPQQLVVHSVHAVGGDALRAFERPIAPCALDKPRVGWRPFAGACVIYASRAPLGIVLAHQEELPPQVNVSPAISEQVVHACNQSLDSGIDTLLRILRFLEHIAVGHVVGVEPHAVRSMLVGQNAVIPRRRGIVPVRLKVAFATNDRQIGVAGRMHPQPCLLTWAPLEHLRGRLRLFLLCCLRLIDVVVTH
mmetsp:Transcript_27367/g.87906  ORF Transcript_27367/g.87906 Transcript_27367/m.87906 type:complete len:290 (+) Transcript_27367:362-1231(+)